jgi:hypothetical protein
MSGNKKYPPCESSFLQKILVTGFTVDFVEKMTVAGKKQQQQ